MIARSSRAQGHGHNKKTSSWWFPIQPLPSTNPKVPNSLQRDLFYSPSYAFSLLTDLLWTQMLITRVIDRGSEDFPINIALCYLLYGFRVSIIFLFSVLACPVNRRKNVKTKLFSTTLDSEKRSACL